MTGVGYLAYGIVAYLLFFAAILYGIGFVGDLAFVPKGINDGISTPLVTALTINVLLLLLFAVQHNVMARPWFKQVWTRIVPQPIERSTYVLASCIALVGLIAFWQPMNLVVWDVPAGPGRWVLWTLFAAGWLMVPLVSLMINHFDLFGTRQVWLHLRGRGYEPLPFRVPLFYKHVRHPLYIGWAMAFWLTPTMTAGRRR